MHSDAEQKGGDMGAKGSWKMVALRGIVAILFGLLAFFWPELTLILLVYLFGAYALVDGVLSIVGALTGRSQPRDWWLALLAGLAGVVVGIAVFVWPGITAVLLLLFIALRALVVGILELVTALMRRQEIVNAGLLALGGVVSMIFGLFVLLRPGAGALALLWLVALYAIVTGVVQLVLAFALWRKA